MTTRFDPFSGEGGPADPRWFAIPAHRPFLDDLAAGVLAWIGDKPPEVLTDATILLPNRRAARAFTSALAAQAGDRPVLLPQVRPLGDLEEDEPPFTPGELGLDLPPAIAPLTRRFEMARMISDLSERAITPLRALALADGLGGFLDSCNIEEVADPGAVADLAPGDLAEHWRASREFLTDAAAEWPRRLAALGLVDVSWRRTRLLRLLAERWTQHPPTGPVIAAGSTGTVKAAAAVLEAVANAPMGCVVLPGLDRGLQPDAWTDIDESHPQAALKRLLEDHGVTREGVRDWFRPSIDSAVEARGVARERLLNEALRPAEATADWREEINRIREAARPLKDPVTVGLQGLSVVTCRAEEETATTLALMMRETLETPGRTCALVTPDLALGRRVAARLERWGVVADVSSGATLDRMPVGVLVDLCVRWIARPMSPHATLAILKHPAVAADERVVRTLEAAAFRGPRARDWAGIADRIAAKREPRPGREPPSDARLADLDAAAALARRMEEAIGQAVARFKPEAPLDVAARALTVLVEDLAGVGVWAGPDGEAAAVLLSQLIEAGSSLGALEAEDFAELVRGLLAQQTVRTGGATHPSLRILGAIEARLVRADRMILAGLEETVWPAAPPTDPFLSRPMRKAMGLPSPERRVGQTAQDFIQAASAPEAILVHSERRGGQPAVRSRWLWRLEMLAKGAGVEVDRASPALPLARALDAPIAPANLSKRPAPAPPVERRPRKLPVTGVERWVRDPYSIYARYVLGLRKLDRPGQSAEQLLRGQAIHKAVERLTLAWPDALPDDVEDRIVHMLIEELSNHGFEEPAMARERPLARNAARWLAGFERRRRAAGVDIRVESEVAMTFAAAGGPFTLTAKADRIELSATGAAVLDFKTGGIPSAKQVKSGLSPQLTLTGAILAEVGPPEGPPVAPEELTYVRVVGRTLAGEAKTMAAGAEAEALSEAALAGLKRRVDRFDAPTTPYPSWVAPQFMASMTGDYDRLARVWEWHVAGGEEGEA